MHLGVPLFQRGEAGQIGVARTWSSRTVDLKLFHAWSAGVLECVRVCRLEVNHPRNSVRVRGGDRAHFCSGDGMADEHRPLQFQGVADGEGIVPKTLEWAIRR